MKLPESRWPPLPFKQKNSTRNPRSTVATATEIYDYLRLLYARAGRTFCTKCGSEVRKDTMDEIAARVLALPQGRTVLRPALHAGSDDGKPAQTAPIPGVPPRRRADPPKKPAKVAVSQETIRLALTGLQRRGFQRLYQAGRMHEFSSPETLLDIEFKKPVYVVVDRLAIDPDMRSRLIDSVEICYREGRGEAILEFVPENPGAPSERMVFNERFECKTCGALYQEPEPRLFSFNNPYGACPRCQGFGNTVDFDINLVIPDRGKSLNEGAIQPWTKPRYRAILVELKKFARANQISMDVPFWNLTEAQQNLIIEGDSNSDYVGVNGFFQWLERKKYKLHVRVFLSRYRGYALCPDCGGSRLRAEARAVRVSGKSITEVCAMTVAQARQFMNSLELGEEQAAIADKILEEIRQRLLFLDEVGLDYLSLDRLSSTLFGRRRSAAHSTGDFVGLASGGRVVRARRAIDWIASARHAPLDQHFEKLARPGEYDPRGGT